MEGKIRPTKLINNVAYYTFGQAMSLLDFSKRTLQRKMKRREIQFLKLGRETFFLQDYIDEYLEKQTVKAKIFIKIKGGLQHGGA
ncbi:MAG: helix-turn-helix domain-containing protein [Fibrobacter sp.]|nr:helix-turn-helix domain-containing protein [Fibrobacter sp.]